MNIASIKTSNHWKVFIFIFCLLGFNSIAYAETITGRVVGVSNGDTLTLLDASKTQVKIRLAAIDAPEKAQPFGNRSKQQLSTLCFEQQAIVEVVDKDRYGRSVGIVICDGVNANETMLSRGMAWVYRQYAKGLEHYNVLEKEAKLSQTGLWMDANPMPPWEWRRTIRSN